MRGLLVCTLACATAALPARVARADEDDRDVGASLSFVRFSLPGHESAGGALGIDHQRGITDVIALRGALLGAVLDGDDGAAYLGQAIVGLTYALDILRYVPYVNLGVGAAIAGGGGLETAIHPEVELGLGLEILRGRSMSYGPFVRAAAYADDSTTLLVGVRVAHRWGFF